MESLAAWLKRLNEATPGALCQTHLRMFIPGHGVMNYDDWLITTEQPSSVPVGLRGGYPESVALMAYVDHANYAQNAAHHQRLSADIASAMSVALERRIEIPYEVAVQVNGQDSMSFLPIGVVTDRAITGPLPSDSMAPVAEIFSHIAGLESKDIAAIGAASSMFHGALILHDRDIRSAYTLLVAGIEALSREYGEPPTNWGEWEEHDDWDTFISEHDLSDEQAEALRTSLMRNKQLRLKATFRSYASSRLRASFWEQPWVEWAYPFQIDQGTWDSAQKLHDGRIRDFLPTDRVALSKGLGHSYNLRSSYVHKGTWFGPLEVALNATTAIDVSRPLPFAALRAILRELLVVELTERQQGGSLPNVRLQRNWKPPA